MSLGTPEQVLSTLESDGSRRWLSPRLSRGRYLVGRRVAAYFLMALFFVLPFVRGTFPYLGMAGRPLFLLDIVARRFTLFGYTFLPTDTLLLALAMMFAFVSIFLFTAVFGRLWCGWACPQTVYMEFLYRPLERLFAGTAGKGGTARKRSLARSVGYFGAALAVTVIPAHTFLAYFVPVDQLAQWVRSSPLAHPTAFAVMAATTALMLFDFYWFREQLCLIACPYGRFQSVLLDRQSLVVSYDRKRGEPRGKLKVEKLKEEEVTGGAIGLRVLGDCVDCGMCVVTCPTGIDIREGLQMECVNCTQCMDACDAVMEKVKRPRGLIRYSSQAAMEGEKVKRLRFRVVFYPVILAILAVAWVAVFSGKGAADVMVLRNAGNPYTVLKSGRIANVLKLKVTNRTDARATYEFTLVRPAGATLGEGEHTVVVEAGKSETTAFVVEAPAEVFEGTGRRDAGLKVTDGKGFATVVPVRLLGPAEVSENDK